MGKNHKIADRWDEVADPIRRNWLSEISENQGYSKLGWFSLPGSIRQKLTNNDLSNPSDLRRAIDRSGY